MDLLKSILDFVLHLNESLAQLTHDYGAWVYGILFLIVFCQTGIVFTAFLPGDSLLFAVGALGAMGVLHPWLAGALILLAAILGDTVNYWVGHILGNYLAKKLPQVIKPDYLARTHAFFDRYGGKTIVLARLVPIVRTFAPFVAGMGGMNYSRFMWFNIAGAIMWVALCVGSGYLFGNIPVIQQHFELVMIGIVIVSLLPLAFEWMRARQADRQLPAE